MTNRHIGRNLKRARLARGLSQTQFVRLIPHLSTRCSISDIERGIRALTFAEAVEFCGILRIELSQLTRTED